MNQKLKNTVKKRWDCVGIFTCACESVRVCLCVFVWVILLCVYVLVVYSACVCEGTCTVCCFDQMLGVNVSDFATLLSGKILYLFL